MSEVISKITKNAREVVLLSLSEFKGRRLIDIRVHVPGDQEGEWLPTRKGISLAVTLYPAFKQGLAQLEQALLQQGLLDPEDLEPEAPE
jgi:Transcriptional Coactivator p15 (PC4)